MEPGEFNLQLMFRFTLARFSPQRRRSWGVSLDWFTNKQLQGFVGSKVLGHFCRAWKIMVKCIYQLPPHSQIELLQANVWWFEGLDLIN